MKITIILGSIIALFFSACSNNSIEEEKLKLEQEKLKLEQEKLKLEKKNNQNSANQNEATDAPKGTTKNAAKITGGSVHLRRDHSTTAGSLGLIGGGEIVEIIDQYAPEGNYSEAILKTPVKFYYENSSAVAFTLVRGKAVQVVGEIDDVYRISFVDDRTRKTGYATIDPSNLEFISGELWYFVSTSSGKKGWVFGKYVQRL
jgi:hypothetical protein